MKLANRLMMARLEAYASYSIREPTLYLDADMFVLRDFDLPPLEEREIGITQRFSDKLMNWRFPIEYPELEGKRTAEVMPFLYSFVYTRSELLFIRQLNRLKKMPRRYHEWYGDQITLRDELQSGYFTPKFFDPAVYNYSVQENDEMNEWLERGVCIAHFKGPWAKERLHAEIELLSRQ